MKKLFGLLAVLFVGFVLVACNNNGDDYEPVDEPEIVEEVTEPAEEEVEEVTEPATEAIEEEDVDPLAAEHEILANWITDTLPQFEEINTESALLFTATTGGFITGTRSALQDVNASVYVVAQIENVVDFVEEVQGFVVQNIDSDDLDLEEARDVIIEGLIGIRAFFLGEE
ncbi:MAG: hypothetical protein FWE07_02205 [Turicibacter sp.]|nr:hypothetical protein [Turicibacter sp.]